MGEGVLAMNGKVYQGGNFNGSSLNFGSTTLNNNGDYDLFLARYDLDGNVERASCEGSAYGDYYQDMAPYSDNRIVICGSTFGEMTWSQDIFWEILDEDCNGPGFTIETGDLSDIATGVATLPPAICLAGSFSSSDLTFGATVLTAQGGLDMFLAKIGNILSVRETAKDDVSMVVYPVPADKWVVFGFDRSYGDDCEIVVCDISGTVVYRNKGIFNGSVKIDVNRYNNGIYTVRVYDQSGLCGLAKMVILHE
jgi:hypothetical protein